MRLLTAIITTLLMTSVSHAIFEVRAGYGLLTPSEEISATSLQTTYGFNIDAIVTLPMIPLGLGLRYENLGSKTSFGSGVTATELEIDVTNIGLLVNYRLIDTIVYAGPVAFIGFSNESQMKVTGAASLNEKFSSDLVYSLGAEVGASLLMLNVGLEAGYFFGKYDAPNNNITINNSSTFDATGIYAKLLVGFGF